MRILLVHPAPFENARLGLENALLKRLEILRQTLEDPTNFLRNEGELVA